MPKLTITLLLMGLSFSLTAASPKRLDRLKILKAEHNQAWQELEELKKTADVSALVLEYQKTVVAALESELNALLALNSSSSAASKK